MAGVTIVIGYETGVPVYGQFGSPVFDAITGYYPVSLLSELYLDAHDNINAGGDDDVTDATGPTIDRGDPRVPDRPAGEKPGTGTGVVRITVIGPVITVTLMHVSSHIASTDGTVGATRATPLPTDTHPVVASWVSITFTTVVPPDTGDAEPGGVVFTSFSNNIF